MDGYEYNDRGYGLRWPFKRNVVSENNRVIALDILEDKIRLLNDKKSPISDPEIEDFLENKQLNFKATTDKKLAYENADFIIVATPTDYDPTTNYFNTKSVEAVIADVLVINPNAVIVIKSTVPVGFTETIKKHLKQITLFSHLSFYERAKLCTIT